jgi:hypothetical protein
MLWAERRSTQIILFLGAFALTLAAGLSRFISACTISAVWSGAMRLDLCDWPCASMT